MSRAWIDLNLKMKHRPERVADTKRSDAVDHFLQWLCDLYGVDDSAGENLGEFEHRYWAIPFNTLTGVRMEKWLSTAVSRGDLLTVRGIDCSVIRTPVQ